MCHFLQNLLIWYDRNWIYLGNAFKNTILPKITLEVILICFSPHSSLIPTKRSRTGRHSFLFKSTSKSKAELRGCFVALLKNLGRISSTKSASHWWQHYSVHIRLISWVWLTYPPPPPFGKVLVWTVKPTWIQLSQKRQWCTALTTVQVHDVLGCMPYEWKKQVCALLSYKCMKLRNILLNKKHW